MQQNAVFHKDKAHSCRCLSLLSASTMYTSTLHILAASAISPATCMPAKMDWSAGLLVQQTFEGKINLRDHIFSGYMDSQSLCEDVTRQWWTRERELKSFRWGQGKFALRELMRLIYSSGKSPEQAPVQSIMAKLGHVSRDDTSTIEWATDRECTSICEDSRTAIEIWFDGMMSTEGKKPPQIREKEPFNMECPIRHKAKIIEVPDLRQYPSQALQDLTPLIQKKHDAKYKGEDSYPSKYGSSRNSSPGKVSQCVCVPKTRKRKREYSSTCVDITEDLVDFNAVMGFKHVKWADSRWWEPASELAKNFNYFTNPSKLLLAVTVGQYLYTKSGTCKAGLGSCSIGL